MAAGEPGALWGTFSEPGKLVIGDPFTKPPASKLSRHGGKQFAVVAPRAGRMPDAYFDKAIRRAQGGSLGEGAPYVDAWILDKRLSRVSGKPVSDKPFAALVGRRGNVSCGPGSTDGCLSAVLLDADGSAAAQRSTLAQRPASKLKDIVTAGPKTGGFGRPWKDRSLGAPPVYYPDVYNGGRLKEKEMAAQAKAASTKPFVPTSHARRAFSADIFLSQQRAREAANRQQQQQQQQQLGAKPASASGHPKPWRSGGPSKQGMAYCTFSQVGRDFMPDPVPQAKFHGRRPGEKPFRPVGSCHARLSMRDINPYATVARPAPDIDFTLFAAG